MLFLSRKPGQSIRINDDIEIKIIEVQGRSVKIGFTFPPHVKVLRQEIYDRILEENKAVSETALAAHKKLEPLLQEETEE